MVEGPVAGDLNQEGRKPNQYEADHGSEGHFWVLEKIPVDGVRIDHDDEQGQSAKEFEKHDRSDDDAGAPHMGGMMAGMILFSYEPEEGVMNDLDKPDQAHHGTADPKVKNEEERGFRHGYLIQEVEPAVKHRLRQS